MLIIDSVPKGIPELNQQVDTLLKENGLRRDAYLDYTCLMRDSESGCAVATGSAFENTLRCFAVRKDMQGAGLLNQMVEHLMNVQFARGNDHVFLYTKTCNACRFASLGFYEIVQAGEISFMENRPGGFACYCRELLRESPVAADAAAVVMNANPFTLGHQALVEHAAAKHDLVHVFVVSEDASRIPFAVRRQLIREGLSSVSNAVVHESGSYIISKATFPSYFLKEETAVSHGYALLDLTVFCRIAKALRIRHRYVGEEPASQVTEIYNQTMQKLLPTEGITCTVIPRRTTADGRMISASAVRAALRDGNWDLVREMTPESTLRYFRSSAAEPILAAIRASGEVKHD